MSNFVVFVFDDLLFDLDLNNVSSINGLKSKVNAYIKSQYGKEVMINETLFFLNGNNITDINIIKNTSSVVVVLANYTTSIIKEIKMKEDTVFFIILRIENEAINLYCDENETIGNLIKFLEAKQFITHKFRIDFVGKALEKNRCFHDYNIQKGSVLEIIDLINESEKYEVFEVLDSNFKQNDLEPGFIFEEELNPNVPISKIPILKTVKLLTCDIKNDNITFDTIFRVGFTDKKEAIIGVDKRILIDPDKMSNPPYNRIVKLYANYHDVTIKGTAWFVSKNVLVTAGHCVYDTEERKSWARIIFIKFNDKIIKVSTIITNLVWVNHGLREYDYGFLILDEKINIDPFRYGFPLENTEEIVICGYPGDKSNGLRLYQAKGAYTIKDELISYLISTNHGQSGSPIVSHETKTVVGMHTTGGKHENSGIRLYPELCGFIQKIISENILD